MYYLASVQQHKDIWEMVKYRRSKGRGWVRSHKNPRCPFFTKVLLSCWGLASIIPPTLLSTSCHYPRLSNSWEFHFAIWHKTYRSPSNSHEATQGHLSLYCAIARRLMGTGLVTARTVLSLQISRAPGNRNVPCLASPVLTHSFPFEADLPLSFSTEGLYLHFVLLASVLLQLRYLC